jgi:hypothetical protein
VDAVGVHLKNSDCPAAHAVTTPAEDDGVDPPWQDSLQQHLTLTLVEEPAHEKLHRALKPYHSFGDKTQESQ